jgi:hypothetical protein
MRKTGRLESAWGSYFVSLGALLPDARENEACALLERCFALLGVPHTEVSYLSSDKRLSSMAQRNFPMWKVREDTKQYPYRHKVGVAQVYGENLNVAIGLNSLSFEPVANIILYRYCDRPCGIEVALGTSTVVKVLRRLNHVVDTFPLPEALNTLGSTAVVRCWKDAAVTSLQLLREGLPSTGQHNRSRLLRTYLTIFKYSPVTRLLGRDSAREVLSRYLKDYYTSPYTLPASRTDDELLNLLIS